MPQVLVDRPLTSQETDLVRWMLEHGHPDYAHLLNQIPDLRVREECDCGCPTVWFRRPGEQPGPQPHGLISDHLAYVDGDQIDVMLFANKESIVCLELIAGFSPNKRFGLPRIEDMFPWEELSNYTPPEK